MKVFTSNPKLRVILLVKDEGTVKERHIYTPTDDPELLKNWEDVTDWVSGLEYNEHPRSSLGTCFCKSCFCEEGELEPFLTKDELIDAFGKHYLIVDREAIEIILATVVGNLIGGDPLWMLLVGASSSGKTELLNMFIDHANTLFISKITKNTLMSGFTGIKEGNDLINDMNDKMVFIKDLAPILSINAGDQGVIMSDLRDAYDGYVWKHVGAPNPETMQHLKKEWRGKFGLIGAATPAVETRMEKFAELGERYVRLDFDVDKYRIELAKAGIQSSGDEDESRAELQELAHSFYNGFIKQTLEGWDIEVPEWFSDRLANLGDVSGRLRTPVKLDRDDNPAYYPEPEVGTRVGKEYLKLAKGNALLNGRHVLNEEDYELVLRVAVDGMPKKRRRLISALYMANDKLHQEVLSKIVEIPLTTLRREAIQMQFLNVLDTEPQSGEWYLLPHIREQIEKTGMAPRMTTFIESAFIAPTTDEGGN